MLVRPITGPVTPALDAALRRGGDLPWENANSGRAPYSLLTDSNVIELWDAADLADGAVSAWAGRKLAASLAQGTPGSQPTRAATSFNSRPGVTFDGAADLLSVGGAISTAVDALAQITIVMAAIDTSPSGAKVVLEYGTSVIAATGSFGIIVNDGGGAGGIETLARGTAGPGYRYGTEALSSARVIATCADITLSTGVQYIRSNGSALSLTTVASTNSGSTTFGSHSLFVGARSGGVLPWPGTIGALALCSGQLTGAALDRVERAVGALVGITW